MATSASNLSNATISSSIAGETGEGCPPESLLLSSTEKRKHAETGNGSPESQAPPSTEKRNRVENVQQPPQSLPPTKEKEPCTCVGEEETMTFDKHPADAQERYFKFKESMGPLWDQLGMGNHREIGMGNEDELLGDTGVLLPEPYW